MTGDRLSQEGRDEPEYPNTRISYQVAPPLTPTLWIECRDSPSNLNPLTTISAGYSGLAVGRDWMWKSCPCWMRLCLILEDRQDNTSSRTGDRVTPERHMVKLEGSCMALSNSTSHMTRIHHGCMWILEIPDLGGYLLQFN